MANTSCLPATLLYFVIYSPLLKPLESRSGSDDKDDIEDAEEQAQVLFYTAKDHAVSKDRVLRQVGLAKALVNFSNMFGLRGCCESVHSQRRRMLMLQPETDYWIHACIELPKVLRSNEREVKTDKGKTIQKEAQYDYTEATLHDGALHSQLQIAYESFKIKNGTFSSILSELGKEALELQLERFFTVWAWKWSLGTSVPFSEVAGVSIHPLSDQLLPIVEASLENILPVHTKPIILIHNQIVARRGDTYQLPPYLARHLLTLARQQSSADHASNSQTDGCHLKKGTNLVDASVETNYISKTSKQVYGNDDGNDDHKISKGGTLGKRFLSNPSLQVNMNATMSALDVRKWSWPGYLSFGGPKEDTAAHEVDPSECTDRKSNELELSHNPLNREEEIEFSLSDSSNDLHGSVATTSNIPIDSQALRDAMSEIHSDLSFTRLQAIEQNSLSVARDQKSEILVNSNRYEESGDQIFLAVPQSRKNEDGVSIPISDPVQDQARNHGDKSWLDNEDAADVDTLVTDVPMSRFTPYNIAYTHLQYENTTKTRRVPIPYISHEGLLVAFLDEDQSTIVNEHWLIQLNVRAEELFENLRSAIGERGSNVSVTLQTTSSQGGLPSKATHVIAVGHDLSYASSFSSASYLLYEARATLACNPGMFEIYSRRQNPQDWCLAKRISVESKSASDNIVYMEVGRKEASLPDVDGELLGVLRRYFG